MLRLLASLLAILGAGDHHPARLVVTAPLPFEVWDGHLVGRAARPFHVRAGGRRFVVSPGLSGRYAVHVPHVAAGATVVTVAGRRIPVYALPPGSLRPLAPARNDPRLDRGLRSLADGVTADVGVYVHRAGGDAAAWNAGAEFEGASTLKLPIMVAALERIGGEPRATAYWTPFTAITRSSSNDAAADAAAGSGRLARHGVSRHEARELLYLMLHAADPGLVAPGAAGRPVAHKIGWLETSRDDVAVVFTRHGPLVVTVYAQGPIDATVYAFGRAAARAALRF